MSRRIRRVVVAVLKWDTQQSSQSYIVWYVSNNHHVLFPFDVSPWDNEQKNINSLCKKIGTSFFAMHRKTMMPFQTRKNPAKKEKYHHHHQRWKNSKKMKKRKMLCFRKSIRGKQLYKKELKMLLQRSLKWKKLKQNKNGKTTVIMLCFSSPSIYS